MLAQHEKKKQERVDKNVKKATGDRKTTENLKRLKKELIIDKAKTEITNKIVCEITDLTNEPSEYKDSTGGKSNEVKNFFQQNLDKFEDLICRK